MLKSPNILQALRLNHVQKICFLSLELKLDIVGLSFTVIHQKIHYMDLQISYSWTPTKEYLSKNVMESHLLFLQLLSIVSHSYFLLTFNHFLQKKSLIWSLFDCLWIFVPVGRVFIEQWQPLHNCNFLVQEEVLL